MVMITVQLCEAVVCRVIEEYDTEFYNCSVTRKVRVIADDNSHVLAKHYE